MCVCVRVRACVHACVQAYVCACGCVFAVSVCLYAYMVSQCIFTCHNRFDHSMREAAFSIGLQGIHKDDVGRVKEIIWSTLETVAK